MYGDVYTAPDNGPPITRFLIIVYEYYNNTSTTNTTSLTTQQSYKSKSRRRLRLCFIFVSFNFSNLFVVIHSFSYPANTTFSFSTVFHILIIHVRYIIVCNKYKLVAIFFAKIGVPVSPLYHTLYNKYVNITI